MEDAHAPSFIGLGAAKPTEPSGATRARHRIQQDAAIPGVNMAGVQVTPTGVALRRRARQCRDGFEDPDARRGYDELYGRAGHLEALEFIESTEHVHMEAGKVVVDRSTVLLAVWDGEPSRGFRRNRRCGELCQAARRSGGGHLAGGATRYCWCSPPKGSPAAEVARPDAAVRVGKIQAPPRAPGAAGPAASCWSRR
jgi:hypothetical protein